MPRKAHQDNKQHIFSKTKEGTKDILKHHRAHLYAHEYVTETVQQPETVKLDEPNKH